MNKKIKNASVSDELHIVRFGNGVKLIMPDTPRKHNSAISVGNFKQLPFSFYILNIDSRTLSINEEGAAICGFQSITHSIGRSLEDVSHPSSATHLINNCSEVIKSDSVKIYEEENVRKDNICLQFLSVKSPCYNDENKIIGILGFSIVVGKHSLANSLAEIKKLGLLDAEKQSSHNHMPLDINKLKANNIYLSQRELDCLHLTVKGYTAKMIAKRLEISHRTVEEYLNNIRIKIGVSSKSQMIEMTLDNFIN